MKLHGKVYVSGHRGMVGSAVCRRLAGCDCELITADRQRLDLRDLDATADFFATERPDIVVFAAARVGGIAANDAYPVEFLSDNLLMSVGAINAAYRTGVRRFLYLGSTCIYPRDCPQPIAESSLLSGPLESTNEAYALAKIGGLKLCQYYRRQYGVMFHSAMPTNLYGPGDNYHPENSHVLPALIRRFHEAKAENRGKVVCWGSGQPLREFLYSDDLADACLFLLQNVDCQDIAFEDDTGTNQAHINVGSGEEISIRELAEMVRSEVAYDGQVDWDTTRPDGTPRKLMDSTRLRNLGWEPRIRLKEGIALAYRDFLKQA